MTQLGASSHSVSHTLLTQTVDLQAVNEGLTRLQRILCDNYTLKEYGELLQLLWAFHEGMELRFAQNKNSELQQRLLARAQAWKIEMDFSQLGIKRNDGLLRRVWAVIPNLADHNERLGSLFVLESTLLKGDHIRKALLRSLGDPVVAKLHYHNEDVRTIEKSCRELVSLIDIYADNHIRALSGAKSTFHAVSCLLNMAI